MAMTKRTRPAYDPWAAPFAPVDPVAYYKEAIVGEVAAADADPDEPLGPPRRTSREAAVAAVQRATGATVDIDANSEAPVSAQPVYEPPTPRIAPDDGLDAVIAADKREQRNARDRARRLERARAKVAAGLTLKGPVPRGR